MPLIHNLKFLRQNNFLTIFLLAIASGLPLALITSTFKIWLTELGINITTIGFISLVTIPYSLKFLWAPVADFVSLPILTARFGRRRSWIIITQLMLFIAIILMSLTKPSGEGFYISVVAAFLVSFASASSDIVIDAYRIELVSKENQGIAASFAVYGYYIGTLISGAGALVLAEFIPWSIVYLMMSIGSLMAITLIIFSPEPEAAPLEKRSLIAPIYDMIKKRGWQILLLFIVLYKLGDVFAGTLISPFLRQIGYSKLELAATMKTFGLFATFFGIAVGGYLAKKLPSGRALWIGGILQMVSNLGFVWQAIVGHDSQLLYFTIGIENICSGIGSAVFVAYISSICSRSYTATQYAIMTSFASFGRSFFAAFAGVSVAYFGWEGFFLFSTCLSIPGLLCLYIINRGIKSGKF